MIKKGMSHNSQHDEFRPNEFQDVFSHKKYPGRCGRCFMRQEVCLCPDLRPVQNRTPVSIIVHQREIYKTTNTSRLATLTLKNTRVFIRGSTNRKPTDLETLHSPEYQSILLTLSDRCHVLDNNFLATLTQPVHLIVPDGNWRQAGKMKTREPALKDIPWVKLPPGPLSVYRLRSEHDPEGLATIEAIARALGIIEGPEVQAELERIFKLMVERTLSTRPPDSRL